MQIAMRADMSFRLQWPSDVLGAGLAGPSC